MWTPSVWCVVKQFHLLGSPRQVTALVVFGARTDHDYHQTRSDLKDMVTVSTHFAGVVRDRLPSEGDKESGVSACG
jgi:hypothetical protein